jgi:dolichol-phosphate mannosyltransferase
MNGAVITALNEADTIGALVKALRGQGLAVCVVDDGSTDDTGKIAAFWNAHVIRHDTRQGIGRSLVEAWRYAIEQGWEQTYQLDAGGSHSVDEEIMSLHGTYDIYIGSRFRPFGQYQGGSTWRKLGSKWTAKALNFATHQHITDWTSGYRVFSRRALLALVDVNYMTNMHTWQIEVLHAAMQRGLTIAEAPITYKAGRSTFRWALLDDLIRVYLSVFFSVNPR